MALTDCASVPGPPTSTTRSTPRPPVSARTLSPHSGEALVSITSSTPISRRRAAFPGLDDVAITRAPSALASVPANKETPPAPWGRTVFPALTPDSADHAVTATHG